MTMIKKTVDEHVGDMLSGFVDGELTQQERQFVSLHCDTCDRCRNDLADLKALRKRIGKAKISEIGEDQWREVMNDSTVQTTRNIGWLMFIATCLVVVGIALVAFIFDDGIPLLMKFLVAGIYGGLALLLFSVLRQRLIERKTDKYKDVEI